MRVGMSDCVRGGWVGGIGYGFASVLDYGPVYDNLIRPPPRPLNPTVTYVISPPHLFRYHTPRTFLSSSL